MDHDRFDALTRALSRGWSRRTAFGVTLGGILSTLGLRRDAAAAKKRRCKPPCGTCERCQKGKCRRTQSGTKRCKQGKCQPKPDGTACGNGQVCQSGTCACKADGRPCGAPTECCATACIGGVCTSCGPCDGVCRHCQGNSCVDKPVLTPCVGGPDPTCATPNSCVCFAGLCSVNVPSDRELKADITPADTGAVLQQVARLPIQTWRYRDEESQVRHMGPMAQDFAAAFGVGSDARSILAVDGQGVALAAIQALHREVQTLTERLAALEAGKPSGICPPEELSSIDTSGTTSAITALVDAETDRTRLETMGEVASQSCQRNDPHAPRSSPAPWPKPASDPT